MTEQPMTVDEVIKLAKDRGIELTEWQLMQLAIDRAVMQWWRERI